MCYIDSEMDISNYSISKKDSTISKHYATRDGKESQNMLSNSFKGLNIQNVQSPLMPVNGKILGQSTTIKRTSSPGRKQINKSLFAQVPENQSEKNSKSKTSFQTETFSNKTLS